MFRSNDHFREAVVQREQADIVELERRLDRRLEPSERARSGLSQLETLPRTFVATKILGQRPDDCSCARERTSSRLEQVGRNRRRTRGHEPRQVERERETVLPTLLEKIPELLRGTLAAPPRVFGETLSHEHIRGRRVCLQRRSPGEQRKPDSERRNAIIRWCAIPQSFGRVPPNRRRSAVPASFREDIINACGVDEVHDGVNYTRTACVIAVSRAKDTFEPFVHQLGFRLAHIARRMLPVAMYLLQKEGRILADTKSF